MHEATLHARLHDGSLIAVEVRGRGPTVLMAVNPQPVEGPAAEELRRWGTDPALGRTLIDGLADSFRVVAFDYEGHVLAVPKPDTLTPANLAGDLLAVADAAGAGRFAYYGYSWLALAGPYEPMLRVTTATHELAVANASSPPAPRPATDDDPAGEVDWSTVEVTLTPAQTRQFVTLYQALQGFDDRAAQAQLGCPRLCFVGSADEITYDERWGGVRVSMADGVVGRRGELEALGWEVRVLEGLDHLQAMQAAQVLPILRPWLTSTLGGS